MMIFIRAGTAVAVIVVVLPGLFGQPGPDQAVKPVAVCEVLGDLPKFSGKDVVILARLDQRVGESLVGFGAFRSGRSSSCQANSSVRQRTLPKYTRNNRNRSQRADSKQRPSRSFPLMFIEAVGNQETDPNA
jgi:hypothetical protein